MTVPEDQTSMEDPKAVYQNWLDETSNALMAGDTAAFTKAVSLPFVMRTVVDVTVQETLDDVLEDAENVVDALRSQQVTDYVRLVKRARYLTEDLIEGWHTTYVLRGAINVVAPYGNRMLMARIDGVWKVCEAEHELNGHRVPLMLLRSEPGAFDARWNDAKAEMVSSRARAEPIYQVFLDSLSSTSENPDFQAWCAHFTLPYEIHYDQIDHIVKDAEETRPFFDGVVTQMQNLDANRLHRSARYAEFLSGDRILGYHETSLLSDDECVFGPVKSRMTLCQEDGRWKCCSVTNSLSNTDLNIEEFLVSGNLPTLREIKERMRK